MALHDKILLQLQGGPLSEKQLMRKLGTDRKKLARAVKELRDNKQIVGKKGVYSLRGVQQPEYVQGVVAKLGRSFAFVSHPEGDIFIPARGLQGALPKDEVKVVLSANPRVADSREGRIVAIVRPHNSLVGRLKLLQGRLVLVPDNAPDHYMPVKRSANMGAKEGELVAVQVLQRAVHYSDFRVGVVQRFGSVDSAQQCAKAILFAAGIEKTFPEEVKLEGKAVAAQPISEQLQGRLDLRDLPIFTIDAASTKDIDDAIYAKKTPNGYELSVHIADVSHYVKPQTALDAEAMKRGTSIYYADSVVPMLPRSLSNGICSLNPNEDRLAFSCIMQLDEQANVTNYQFKKAVICSCVKGVYSEVNQIIGKTAGPELLEKYKQVLDGIDVMYEIYQKLAILRKQRGSFEIESSEPEMKMDEQGICIDIKKRVRGEAERLIEEFMLLANNSAANFARKRSMPFVYRVHDKPSSKRVDMLKDILDALGVAYNFKSELPSQAELGEILSSTRGTPLEIPVHQMVLRSMAKAVYEPQPKGHYGLALQDYAHFTSPIRRYPDLAIHRILSDAISGTKAEKIHRKYETYAQQSSSISTSCEQQAVQIERSCDACYAAEYMKPRIGQSYSGIIMSVTNYGLYVVLPNTVEGLVPVHTLSDYRLELQEGVSLTDPVTNTRWRVGGDMRVKVVGVDIAQGHVDFVPD